MEALRQYTMGRSRAMGDKILQFPVLVAMHMHGNVRAAQRYEFSSALYSGWGFGCTQRAYFRIAGAIHGPRPISCAHSYLALGACAHVALALRC